MDQATLKEHLHYNPITGMFTWVKTTGRVLKGTQAGSVHKHRGGYINIGFRGKNYKAHRLAFLYMTGSIPPFVDHDDRDRSNNKWSNLIAATITINNKNCSKQHNNKSGVTGVSWDKKRKLWAAQIGNRSKQVVLGRFEEKLEAGHARKDAEILYNYSKGHGQKKGPLSVTSLPKTNQKETLIVSAFKEYLEGTTISKLSKKYGVSKRLKSWLRKYAIDTGQLIAFEIEQKAQRKLTFKQIGASQHMEVCQLSSEGVFIAKYSSMLDAAKATGLNQGNISNVCTGRQITTGGFKWQLL